MARRITLALAGALLASITPAVGTGTAAAVDGEVPTLGTPTFTVTSAASVQVSVSVDSHGSDTTVVVEYATAGAYRLVPSAATTVTIGTTPASAAGPVTMTGPVTGLDPGSTYRMRVRATNAGGEAVSVDTTVAVPAAPRPGFRAKVGADTTKLTRLTVAGLVGGESVALRCRTRAKGCPFTSRTVDGVAAGTLSLSSLLKRDPLDPGAKVVVQVSASGVRLSMLTLVVRDDQQPKVKRG